MPSYILFNGQTFTFHVIHRRGEGFAHSVQSRFLKPSIQASLTSDQVDAEAFNIEERLKANLREVAELFLVEVNSVVLCDFTALCTAGRHVSRWICFARFSPIHATNLFRRGSEKSKKRTGHQSGGLCLLHAALQLLLRYPVSNKGS